MRDRDYEAISKELLAGLPGYEAKGDLIFLAPIGDLLRGICYERSADARDFCVWAFFLPLFIPRNHISFGFGEVLRQPNRRQWWNADDEELVPKLSQIIARDGVPYFSQVSSASDIVREALARLHLPGPHYQNTLAYALARTGAITESLAAFDNLMPLLDSEVSWQRELADRALGFKNLLETDPEKAQRQLDDWRDESLRNLGLEKYR